GREDRGGRRARPALVEHAGSSRRSTRPVGAVCACASPPPPPRTTRDRRRALAALRRDASVLPADPRAEAVRLVADARDEQPPCATVASPAPMASAPPRRRREAARLVPPRDRARVRPCAAPRLELPGAARAQRLPPLCRVRRREPARRVLAAQPRVSERRVRRLGDRLVPVLGRPPRDRDRAPDARLPARTWDDA